MKAENWKEKQKWPTRFSEFYRDWYARVPESVSQFGYTPMGRVVNNKNGNKKASEQRRV
jgi:hypothetical protein